MLRVLAVLAALSLTACNRQDWPLFQKADYRVSAADRSSTVQPISTPPQSYADVVDRVSPTVVTIRSAKRVREAQQFPFLDDPFFRRFFGNPQQRSPRGGSDALQHALGSGVIVQADGVLLTNHHVVDGADQITVELPSRQTFFAKLIGSDAPSDLAVLKIDASSLPTLSLGNSDRVRVGDVCLALGNPMGIGETVTAGIISAKGRFTGLSDGSFEDFLQTDAAINQGNSGGPMFSMRGQVIGIVSHIISKSGGYEGLGFVVSSNMVRQLLLERRPFWSGVTWFQVSGDLAEYLNLPQRFGLLVEEVAKRSPAEAIGLRPSRVVAKVDGRDIPLGGDIVLAAMGIQLVDETSFQKVRERWGQLRSGDEMTFRVFRAGRVIDLKGRLP